MKNYLNIDWLIDLYFIVTGTIWYIKELTYDNESPTTQAIYHFCPRDLLALTDPTKIFQYLKCINIFHKIWIFLPSIGFVFGAIYRSTFHGRCAMSNFYCTCSCTLLGLLHSKQFLVLINILSLWYICLLSKNF